MAETIIVWFGALGVGLIAGFVSWVLTDGNFLAVSERALARICILSGFLVWVILAKAHLYFGEPHWPWVLLYTACWLCIVFFGLICYSISETMENN